VRLRAPASRADAERAQVKQSDPGSEFIPLESICSSIIGTAKSMGVTVVK
jgi:large subunit ribosomal protein L11